MWSEMSISSLTPKFGRRLPAALERKSMSAPAARTARIIVRSG